MGNRIILTVREVTRELNSEDIPQFHTHQYQESVRDSPVSVDAKQLGIISEADIWELRKMRAEAV